MPRGCCSQIQPSAVAPCDLVISGDNGLPGSWAQFFPSLSLFIYLNFRNGHCWLSISNGQKLKVTPGLGVWLGVARRPWKGLRRRVWVTSLRSPWASRVAILRPWAVRGQVWVSLPCSCLPHSSGISPGNGLREAGVLVVFCDAVASACWASEQLRLSSSQICPI